MSQEGDKLKSEPKKFFYGWIITLCCTLITVINGGCFFTVSIFFKPVAFDFGWSRGEFAINYTVMLIAYAPGAFFGGKLAERVGPRVILLLGGLLIGLGFIGCSRADNLLFMILCYAVVGLGLGTTLVLTIATVQRWFVKWRGFVVGAVSAGNGIGGMIFAPLANYLITAYDWRVAYLVIGLISGTVIIASASFLVAEPGLKNLRPFGRESQRSDVNSDFRTVSRSVLTSAQVFKMGTFWGVTTIYILTHLSSMFISAHLIPYVTDKGISAAVGAQAIGFIAGMIVVGRIVLSSVAGKIGWLKTLSIAFLIGSISIIWLMFVTKPLELYVFVVFYGFFWGSTIALLGGTVGYLFGMNVLSELLGFLLGLGVMMGAVSPWLGGFIFDLTGSYFIAMVSAAVFFAGAGIIPLFLRPAVR
ncbi:MFS transporter [Chloroflexota bacterium]